MNNKLRTDRRLKTKRKRRKIFVILFIILVAFFATIGVYATNIWNRASNVVDEAYNNEGREGGSTLRDEVVDIRKDNISILLIGVDQGGGRSTSSYGLSDALLLATLNVEERSVKLLSIPRDSYVYVPLRNKFTKINHAHAYGGPKATIDTLEHLIDIPIDYYFRINFDAFMDVVDVLGGIEVEVPYALSEMNSNDEKGAIELEPGLQWLDGEEALALARTRRMDNDIERGKRQQDIISAMMKRVASPNTLLNINPLIDAVGNNLATDMRFDDMSSLMRYGISGEIEIETLNLEGSDMVTDAYYYKLDEDHLDLIITDLKKHLGIDR